jgi:hypothetical protein
MEEEYPCRSIRPDRRRVLRYVQALAGLALLVGYSTVLVHLGFATQVALAMTTTLCMITTQWAQRTIADAVTNPRPDDATTAPVAGVHTGRSADPGPGSGGHPA